MLKKIRLLRPNPYRVQLLAQKDRHLQNIAVLQEARMNSRDRAERKALWLKIRVENAMLKQVREDLRNVSRFA